MTTHLASGNAGACGEVPDNITLSQGGKTEPGTFNIIPSSSSSYELDKLATNVTKLEDLNSTIAEQLESLSGRVATLEVNKGTENDGAGYETPEDVLARRMLRTIPKVRDCNWQQFKNRLDGAEEDFAVEVLRVGDDLGEQIQFEQFDRLSRDKRKSKRYLREMQKLRKRIGVLTETSSKRIDRVRINSAIVLHFLSGLYTQIWSGRPHTFLKPFKLLIYFHEKMEECFRILEKTFGPSIQTSASISITTIQEQSIKSQRTLPIESQDANRGLSARFIEAPGSEIQDTPESADENKPPRKDTPVENTNDKGRENIELQALIKSEKAYQDMKCYVEFVRSELLPLYHKFDKTDSSHPTTVRYDELWYLFRCNGLINQRSDSKDEARSTTQQGYQGFRADSTSHRIWRVYRMRQDSFELRMPRFDDGTGKNHGEKHLEDTDSEGDVDDSDHDMSICCYSIDYDGHSYSAVPRWFYISRYDGEKDISKLEIYPLCFARDQEAIYRKLQERGRKFQEIISSQEVMAYDGWTLSRDPAGELIEDVRGVSGSSAIHIPQHIDSDVIIDTLETFQNHPWWKPRFSRYLKNSFSPETRFDPYPINRWTSTRSHVVEQTTEAVISKDEIDCLEWNAFAEGDPFIFDTEDREDDSGDNPSLSDEDLVLLPGHFIRGKGRGLVILLHGAPGVGKTATAEAVAYTHRKPLFPITCGDLGTTPDVVELKLTQIFRFAHLWDCVLLLDEAEIFLSQRRKNDDTIKRNAMVSIFLRTLEYYQGILFLTTNRPGVLDEAVKSRVHISLDYPKLGLEQTIALFQTNIARLKAIEEERARVAKKEVMQIKDSELLAFAADHFRHHTNTRWNGHQIRNAFQIAASLAHYEKLRTSGQIYDYYRQNMYGKEEDEMAAHREERGHQPSEAPQRTADRMAHSHTQAQQRAPSGPHQSMGTLQTGHSRARVNEPSTPGYHGAAQNPPIAPSTPLMRHQISPSSFYGTSRLNEETDLGYNRSGSSSYIVEASGRGFNGSEEQLELSNDQGSFPTGERSPSWRGKY